MLEREGHEGLLADGRPIDVLLTDLALPELNGLELAALVREHHPDVTVLLMSGYSATTVPAGEAELVEKPFTPALLRERVAAALSSRRRAAGSHST